MQANWNEMYLTQVGYFSHVYAGGKASQSGRNLTYNHSQNVSE